MGGFGAKNIVKVSVKDQRIGVESCAVFFMVTFAVPPTVFPQNVLVTWKGKVEGQMVGSLV